MSIQQVNAVILAGGSGSRLWPLSRQDLPKQFLALEGNTSLLQSTIDRLQPLIAAENVLIVSQETHAKGEAYHCLRPYQNLYEPVGRNTAPAIALAAAYLLRTGEDPVMVVLPADHIIKQPATFRQHLADAIEIAAQGQLITFGIQPTRPDTGFGYIQIAPGGTRHHKVQRFTEKPDLATAQQFLTQGDYFWNAGVFVWKASVILQEVAQYLPELHQIIQEILAHDDFEAAVKMHFHRMPSISIDYGVLEKSARVSLIPCDIGWNDVGSWQAVHEVSTQDAAGNALQGDVIAVNCKNSLIRAEKRLVAAIGMEDVCIVETADAVLVTRNTQSQEVRSVVAALQERGSQEHVCHTTVRRPWGSYTVLEEDSSGFKVKRIEVAPGASLSLQSHQHRSEHWVVVAGVATVSNNGQISELHPNQSTYIPMGHQHKLENKGSEPLYLVEIQVGRYLGEDDICRHEDGYGR